MRPVMRLRLLCALAVAGTACTAKEQTTGTPSPQSPYAGQWTSFDLVTPQNVTLSLGGFTVAANGAFGFGTTTQVAGFFNDGGAVAGAIVVSGPPVCQYSFVGAAGSTTAAAGSVSVDSPSDTTLCTWRGFTAAR